MRSSLMAALRWQAALNTLANLWWSALSLLPISIYCYRYLDRSLLWFFIGLSLLFFFFPNSLVDRMRLSRNSNLYRKLGVRLINQLAQNGYLVNKLIRWRYPEFRGLKPERASIRKLYQQTYLNEKFHWAVFVFFVLVMGFAIIHQQWRWALLFLFTNILYNIYPIWLQQYLRLRLKSFRRT